jgi:hypothetical protein
MHLLLQASAGGRIVARETSKALRKDVQSVTGMNKLRGVASPCICCCRLLRVAVSLRSLQISTDIVWFFVTRVCCCRLLQVAASLRVRR